jgi:hypothetical protein
METEMYGSFILKLTAWYQNPKEPMEEIGSSHNPRK